MLNETEQQCYIIVVTNQLALLMVMQKMAENIVQNFFNRMSNSAMHEPTSTVDLMEKMAQKFFVNVY